MIFRNHGKKLPTDIFGNNFPTRDGTCIRYYIHIKDIVEAILIGLKSFEARQLRSHLVLNLGSKSGASVLQLLKPAKNILGEQIDSIIAPSRKGDPAISLAIQILPSNRLNLKLEMTPGNNYGLLHKVKDS